MHRNESAALMNQHQCQTDNPPLRTEEANASNSGVIGTSLSSSMSGNGPNDARAQQEDAAIEQTSSSLQQQPRTPSLPSSAFGSDEDPQASKTASEPKQSLSRRQSFSIPSPIVGQEPIFGELSETEWYLHRKHLLVMTDTGKPIFSRHGDEIQLSCVMGLCSALYGVMCRVFTDQANDTKQQGGQEDGAGDAVQVVVRGDALNRVTVVFMQRGPLLLINIDKTPNRRYSSLLNELDRVYSQIVSSLTLIFERFILERRYFDPLRLLSPFDRRLLKTLVKKQRNHVATALGGIEPLALSATVRLLANCAIRYIQTPDPILAGLIVAGGRLVALSVSSYLPAAQISSDDLCCVISLLTATSHEGESWMPICLPKFNSQSFINLYVNYVADDVCVVYFSASLSTDQFHTISTFCRSRCVPVLEKSGCLDAILKSLACSSCTMPSEISGPSHLVHCSYLTRRAEIIPQSCGLAALGSLQHFIMEPHRDEQDEALNAAQGSKRRISVEAEGLKGTALAMSPGQQPPSTDSPPLPLSATLAAAQIDRLPVSRTQLRQVFSFDLTNPISSFDRIEDRRERTKQIIRLYQLAFSLAQESQETAPVQLLLETKHLRVLCILTSSMQIYCCTPAWADLPSDNFRSIFQWLQQQHQHLFVPISFLTHFIH